MKENKEESKQNKTAKESVKRFALVAVALVLGFYVVADVIGLDSVPQVKAETNTNGSTNTGESANATTSKADENTSVVNGDVQEINTTLQSGSYPAITVQEGIPVVWTINVDKSNLNGCNNQIIIPKYNIQQKLEVGENVIKFTPTETGKFGYSCWMGMVRSSITVTSTNSNSDSQSPDTSSTPSSDSEIDNTGLPSGCCG